MTLDYLDTQDKQILISAILRQEVTEDGITDEKLEDAIKELLLRTIANIKLEAYKNQLERDIEKKKGE